MKKIILFLLPVLLISETIKPRIIKVPSRGRGYGYSRGGGGNPVEMSTIEASTQATSVGFLALSSVNMERQNRYSKREIFLRENRQDIVKDISKGKGEYLLTLLELMRVKPTQRVVQNLQQNIITLSKLDDREFLKYISNIRP